MASSALLSYFIGISVMVGKSILDLLFSRDEYFLRYRHSLKTFRKCLSFCLNCSYCSNVFIKIHEYSN